MRSLLLDILCRLVFSMLDILLMEMRDVVIEKIRYRGKLSVNVNVVIDFIMFKLVWFGLRDEMVGRFFKEICWDGSFYLDGLVIVYWFRDEEVYNGVWVKVFLYELGKGVSGLDGFLEWE